MLGGTGYPAPADASSTPSRRAWQALCARGHDGQAVAGHPEREALSDPDVLALARAERRAVVTNNIRDFRPLHVEAVLPGGPGHYGMIFMPGTYRRSKNDIGRIVAALEAKLGQYPGEEDLVNAEEWLQLHHAIVVLGVGGSSPSLTPSIERAGQKASLRLRWSLPAFPGASRPPWPSSRPALSATSPPFCGRPRGAASPSRRVRPRLPTGTTGRRDHRSAGDRSRTCAARIID
jgi:hypothetical protein